MHYFCGLYRLLGIKSEIANAVNSFLHAVAANDKWHYWHNKKSNVNERRRK